MIDIIDKKDCNGCNACIDACPHGAIQFTNDHEGFWYPGVDMNKCTDCSLCEHTCPELNADSEELKLGDEPVCYAVRHIKKEIIKDSTSGGIFSAFAEAIYAEGGYVAGAVYDENFGVHHIVSNNPDDLPRLRSSKYLQSNCTGLYVEIKKLLKAGKKVLACGTPCQMAALRLFLGKEYENLIICDFICRGINSPMVFRKHLDSLEKKYGSKVVYAKAKNKEYGWRALTFKATFENGQSYYGDGKVDDYTRGYLRTAYYCRPSCFDCKFKSVPRIADITFGDFWGVEKVAPSLDDNLGTSLAMCNTSKGLAFFEGLKNSLEYRAVKLEDIAPGNRSLYRSIEQPQSGRDAFFRDLARLPFSKVANKHFPKEKILSKCKRIAKSILRVPFKLYRTAGFSPVALYQFVWINFMRRNTKSSIKNMNLIFPTRDCVFDIHPSAKVVVNGPVTIGLSKVRGSRLETRIRLEQSAQLHFGDSFSFYAGGDIQVFSGGKLTFEGGPSAGCNIHCQIVCADSIVVGKSTLIGRNVVIRDYDAHYILQDGYKIKSPIKIADHCWVGDGAYIGKGVSVGNGSIVAARSWVVNSVPEKMLVAGVPAMPVSKNIEWRV